MTTRPPVRNFLRIALATVAAASVGPLARAASGPSTPAAVAPAASPGISTVELAPRTVPINDTIKVGNENITFSGQAKISGQIIDDTLTRAPRVLQLLIDFSAVTAAGQSSKKKYVTNAQSIIHRPLLSYDPIEVSFPYHAVGDFSSARSALATFSVALGGPTGLTITSKLSPAS
jgi:hypothetical protein